MPAANVCGAPRQTPVTITRQDRPGVRSAPVRSQDEVERIAAVLEHFSQHRSPWVPRDRPPEEADR